MLIWLPDPVNLGRYKAVRNEDYMLLWRNARRKQEQPITLLVAHPVLDLPPSSGCGMVPPPVGHHADSRVHNTVKHASLISVRKRLFTSWNAEVFQPQSTDAAILHKATRRVNARAGVPGKVVRGDRTGMRTDVAPNAGRGNGADILVRAEINEYWE
jgi:hypothetical protein